MRKKQVENTKEMNRSDQCYVERKKVILKGYTFVSFLINVLDNCKSSDIENINVAK